MNSPNLTPPRPRQPMDRLLLVGYALLIAASLFHFLVGRQVVPENGAVDFVEGLLYGLCIASLLFGIRRMSRHGSVPTCRPE